MERTRLESKVREAVQQRSWERTPRQQSYREAGHQHICEAVEKDICGCKSHAKSGCKKRTSEDSGRRPPAITEWSKKRNRNKYSKESKEASCKAYTVRRACVRCEVHCCFLRNKQLCRFETLEQELQGIQQLAKQNIRNSGKGRPLERQPCCKRNVSPKLSKELSVPLRGQKHTGGRLHSI